MRLVVSSLIVLILLSALVSAVAFRCQTDSDCTLAIGENIPCVANVCQRSAERTAVAPVDLLKKKEGVVGWSLVAVQTAPPQKLQSPACVKEGCVQFAPAYSGPLSPFLRWLLYA